MPNVYELLVARRILGCRGNSPLPEHIQAVCDMIGYLENWATPERIAAGRSAALKMHVRMQAKEKEKLEKKMEKYKKGVNMIGKKNFENLTRDIATLVCKEMLVTKQYKISEMAVKKYKKSTQFKLDQQVAKQAQKKLDAKNETMAKIRRMTTGIKAELRKLPPEAKERMVEKYGLHELKRVEYWWLPEKRPRWLR